MRIILRWLDQLRNATTNSLPSFCDRLVATFEELAAAANTWAATDHNDDGTHQVVRIGGTTTAAEATRDRISLYWDGTNLKYVKPDGTTGNVV